MMYQFPITEDVITYKRHMATLFSWGRLQRTIHLLYSDKNQIKETTTKIGKPQKVK